LFLYLFFKFLHVFSAMISVGANMSYGVWLMKGNKEKEHLLFSVKGIKFLDDFVANPCYFIALISGFIMLYLSTGSIKPFTWNLYALILFSFMGIIAFIFYTPYLSKQIKLLEENKYDSDEYKSLEKKQNYIGYILGLIALVIVILMVFKPSI
jgi:hypothetical protein